MNTSKWRQIHRIQRNVFENSLGVVVHCWIHLLASKWGHVLTFISSLGALLGLLGTQWVSSISAYIFFLPISWISSMELTNLNSRCFNNSQSLYSSFFSCLSNLSLPAHRRPTHTLISCPSLSHLHLCPLSCICLSTFFLKTQFLFLNNLCSSVNRLLLYCRMKRHCMLRLSVDTRMLSKRLYKVVLISMPSARWHVLALREPFKKRQATSFAT